MAQATIRFLAQQWSERDGERQRLFAGCLGIFGHGNVAGIGQALLQEELAADRRRPRPALRPRPQRAGHGAHRRRLREAEGPAPDLGLHRLRRARLDEHAHRCRARDDQPDSGAAVAFWHLRDPCLGPVLQELEKPYAGDVTVNDAFRPLSRFFDEVMRPEQLPSALLSAMRVLTDPVETGAVTISLPQDVQAEAFDWPVELFDERAWHVPRPVPEAAASPPRPTSSARRRGRSSSRGAASTTPGPRTRWRRSASATGIPVGETQAGKGSLPHGHPQLVGCGRLDRDHRRQRARRRGRRRHRHRHPLERLHDRLTNSLSRTAVFASSTSTWPRSTPASRPASRSSATPASRCRLDRGPRRLAGVRHLPQAAGRSVAPMGRARRRRHTTLRAR